MLLLLAVATTRCRVVGFPTPPLPQSSSSAPPSTAGASNSDATDQSTSSSRSHDTCISSSTQSLLDMDRLKKTIATGRVYQQDNFLSSHQVSYLLNEIENLEQSGGFRPSGLSNTLKGKQQEQGFDASRDRITCEVPWWKELLLSSDATADTVDSTRLYQNNTAALKINQLRHDLSQILSRPTMKDANLAHECYYSVSHQGAFLPRHMDERHEELKGRKGWLLPSRRSLSWLIYLSDENWTVDVNGGALRSFPQEKLSLEPDNINSGNGYYARSSQQPNGDLQVGWLSSSSSLSNNDDGVRPVYLNSWFAPIPGAEPHCVLYIVVNRDSHDNETEYLTHPWLTDALQGMSVSDFLQAMTEQDARSKPSSSSSPPQLFLQPEMAQHFSLLEDRPAWDRDEIPQGAVVEDINPVRGRLVVFDSLLVPHQVQVIKEGRRSALAGWFHEETQQFPEDFYSAME